MNNNLKNLIRESGLKQYIFADKIGISGNTLSCYIMGIRKPKYDTAVKMAKILSKYLDREVEEIFFEIYKLNYDKQKV